MVITKLVCVDYLCLREITQVLWTIDLQEQIFASMQNQGRTFIPMQNQEQSPVPVQRQEQARLERALALLSAHPQILDALERINTGYQTQATGNANPHVSATLNFVQ